MSQHEHAGQGGDIEKLWEMVKDIKFAMFTTRHRENGHLHSRPMTTQNRKHDEGDAVYFFMPSDSDPVHDLQSDAQVNLAYSDGDDTWVSVSGTAELVDDVAMKRQLWNKPTEAWMPEGPESPHVALVRVRISHADYWDVTSNKLVQLYTMAKTAITGHPPKNPGDTGHVRMH